MSTSFPTTLDSYTRPLATEKLNNPSHVEVHDNVYDAIEALEAKLGVDSSGVATSIDYKVRSKQTHVTVGTVANPGDYTCDGVADNVQIKAAIDAVLAAGGGKIWIREGLYDIAAAITVTLGGKSLIIEGEGDGTILSISSLSSSEANSGLVVTGSVTVGADRIGIRDMQFLGNATGGMGLRLKSCYQGDATNLRFKNFTAGSGWGVGFWLDQTIDITIDNCVTTGCIYAGLQIQNTSNANTILGGWFHEGGTGSVGVRISASNGNTFTGSIFESNDLAGVLISSSARATHFYGCWFEDQVDGLVIDTALHTDVSGCWFTLNTSNDIEIGAGAQDTTIFRNRFNDGGTVAIASGAARVTISQNTNLSTVTDSGGTDVSIFNNPAYTGSQTLTLKSGGTGNALQIDQDGNVGTDIATDGAIHIENTGNTGIGLGVYTNIGATADSPLVIFKVDNTAFDQNVVQIVNDAGTSALLVTHNGDGRGVEIRPAATTKSALYVEANTVHSGTGLTSLMAWVQDNASATGTLTYMRNDGTGILLDLAQLNASATGNVISVNNDGTGKGLFIDHDDTGTNPSVDIDRDGNNAAKIWGIKVTVDNAGAGGVGGIDFSGMSVDEAIFKGVADAITVLGTISHQIPIDIGGTLFYLVAYTHGS